MLCVRHLAGRCCCDYMVGQVTKRVLIKPGRRPIHARFTVLLTRVTPIVKFQLHFFFIE